MRSKDVEPRVEHLLKDSELYRNNRKALLLKMWEDEGLHLNRIQVDKFMQCTPAESILRAARTLAPDYPPSDETLAIREDRFREELQDHSQAVSWLKD